jgi:hypothetical protein
MGFTHRYSIAPIQGCMVDYAYNDGLHPSLFYLALSGLHEGIMPITMGFSHRYSIAPFQGCTVDYAYYDGLHASLVYRALSGLHGSPERA